MDFLIKFPSMLFLIFSSPDAPKENTKTESKQEAAKETQQPANCGDDDDCSLSYWEYR